MDRATWLNLAQGPVQQTGNPLDVAHQRQQIPHACTTAERRALHAQRRAAGQQRGPARHLRGSSSVVGDNGPIVFQSGDRNVAISSDGTISVREGNNTTDSQRGKLAPGAEFAQPAAPARRTAPRPSWPIGGEQARRRRSSRASFRARSRSRTCSGVQSRSRRMIEVHPHLHQVAGMLQQQSDMRRSVDRETRRSAQRLMRNLNHACSSHRRHRHDGAGTQRPGDIEQYRQHAHDWLQAPARRVSGPALRTRAPRRHADLGSGQRPAGRRRAWLRRARRSARRAS